MNEKKNAKDVLVCSAKKRQKFFFGSVRLKETGGEKKRRQFNLATLSLGFLHRNTVVQRKHFQLHY